MPFIDFMNKMNYFGVTDIQGLLWIKKNVIYNCKAFIYFHIKNLNYYMYSNLIIISFCLYYTLLFFWLIPKIP
jgi:hypothetical protein